MNFGDFTYGLSSALLTFLLGQRLSPGRRSTGSPGLLLHWKLGLPSWLGKLSFSADLHATENNVCGPPSHPCTPPIWVVTECRAGIPVLCSRFPLAIYFARGGVHVSIEISRYIPPPFPRCVHTSILYVCVSVHALQIGSSVRGYMYTYS